jgi:hypothetical protein
MIISGLNKNKKLIFILLVVFTTANCQNENHNFSTVINLPQHISESSGLEELSSKEGFWTINDAGNSNDLFLFDIKGKMIQKVKIANAKNKDWEALASDGKSMLYIGDFGNNHNSRKDLTIYSVDIGTIRENRVNATKTTFTYEDQTRFPPKEKNRNFDAEAFIYYNNNFYIFSKNRSSTFDGTTKMYKVSAEPGETVAIFVGEFKTCKNEKKCRITGADISEDGKQLALLTHDSIYLFSNFKNDNFFDGENMKIELMHNSQKEGICFKENELYITDEGGKSKRGKLYKLELNN